VIFRFRWERLGAHEHVAVYAASAPGVTFGKLGDLVMAADEWRALRGVLVHLAGGDEYGDGAIDIEAGES